MNAHAGLYAHIPFCLTRCGYCDFNTYAGLEHLTGGYVEAMLAEAAMAAPAWSGTRFVSIFLGGGTPTMLPPEALHRLLLTLRERFDVDPAAEVTCEANPDTVDERSLAALRAAGVGRLSLGVQSFDPTVLAALERLHSPASARRAMAAARASGFDDVNLDLIYGADGETPGSWARTLEEALALAPEHVSAYALTVEPNTALGRKVAAGLVPVPDPDRQAERYETACAELAAAGYVHYEVSNWAKPGRECVHNLGYWEDRPYLGLGAGAHSHRGGWRWWNVRPPAEYARLVGAGAPPIGGEEEVSPGGRRLERLLLGLRTARGIPLEWIDVEGTGPFVAGGLAVRDRGRLRLTERGMLLANEVVLALAG